MLIIQIIKVFLLIIGIYYFGFVIGFFGYLILFNFYLWIIERLFDYQYVSPLDMIYLFEYNNSPNLIIASIVIDRINIEILKNSFLSNGIRKFKRLSQIVIKFLNEFYWKSINPEDCLNNIKIIYHINDNNDIIRFSEEKFSISLDIEKPLWEIFFQENFGNDKSLIIIRFHHTLGDGIAMVNLFSSLCSEKIDKSYTQLNKLGFFERLLVYVISPFYFIRYSPPKVEKTYVNPFGSHISSGINRLAISKEYEFSKFKNIYSNFEGSKFNDLIWAIVIISLYKCKKNISSIIGIMGISYRENIIEGEMGNYSSGQLIRVDNFYEDIQSQIKEINKSTKNLKNKKAMIGGSFIFSIIIKYLLNDNIFKKLGESMNYISFILTNVQGPNKTLYMDGNYKIYDIFAFVPHANLPFSILTFTYNGKMKISLNADYVNGPPIDEIMNLIESEIDRIL